MKRFLKKAFTPFSSIRNVVGNFNYANETLLAVLKDLKIKTFFISLKAVIQQTEGTEGGLSDIEKRALRELAEMAGANKVYLSEQDKVLSTEEAL